MNVIEQIKEYIEIGLGLLAMCLILAAMLTRLAKWSGDDRL